MTESTHFLTLQEVIQRIKLQKSWVYQAIKTRNFPAPLSIPGARRTLFSSQAIDAWIAERAGETAGAPAKAEGRGK